MRPLADQILAERFFLHHLMEKQANETAAGLAQITIETGKVPIFVPRQPGRVMGSL